MTNANYPEIKFNYNGVDYNTTDFLTQFVDENTDEVKQDMYVLNKRIRLLWFRSVYPKARIEKKLLAKDDYCIIPDNLLKHLVDVSDNKENLCDKLDRISNRYSSMAIASASVYLDVNDEKPIATDYAVRFADKSFTYNNEAALNAAVDRAIIDCGFTIPQELLSYKPDNTQQADELSVSAQKIADIEALIEGDTSPDVNEPVKDEPFDLSTPVDKIKKLITKEQAESYVISSGKHKGKTVKQLYSETQVDGNSKVLTWYAEAYQGKDNILRAACEIVNG